MAKILVVGVGNLLRRDDGFGVEVAKRLAARGNFPKGVKVVEVGIAGISLVQELFDGYDALIIVDAVEQGGAPGTTYLLEPKVPKVDSHSQKELAGCSTEPSKALILAKALGVLPKKVLVVGAQPEAVDELRTGLSEPVEAAAEEIVANLQVLLPQWLQKMSEQATATEVR